MGRQLWWRVPLVGSGVALAVAQHMHPAFNTALPTLGRVLASPMYSSAWVPVHALILVGFVLMAVGVVGLARSGLLGGKAQRAVPFVLAGCIVSAIEMVFHLFAFVDRDAVAAGRAAPIFTIHQALQQIDYPLLGLGVAALAVLELGRLDGTWMAWPWRVFSAIAILGSVIRSFAPLAVAVSQSAAPDPMFAGTGPMVVYIALLGLAVSSSAATVLNESLPARTAQRQAQH